MRDVDERGAGGAQLGEEGEQAIDFLRRQRRRRLVQDQELCVRAQRARDLDELLFRQAERGGFAVDVDPSRRRAPGASRARSRRAAPVDPRPRPGRLQPECEILGDAEIREERGMLMNRGNAERPGGGRCEHVDRPAVVGDRAGVRRQRARDDAHECRLAGAVFADERVDLAAAHLQRRVGQRAHAGEVFCEMFDDRAWFVVSGGPEGPPYIKRSHVGRTSAIMCGRSLARPIPDS